MNLASVRNTVWVAAALSFAALAAAPSNAPAPPANEERLPYQHLIDAANAVVGVKVKALANARSSRSLGAERIGSGVVIAPDGLVLTIGYLILEADDVELVTSKGRTVPATVAAYDHATGFGLLRPIGALGVKPIRFGSSAEVAELDRLMIAAAGGEDAVSVATVVSRRRFAGYWEYLIDGAIFTSPPRGDHSGAALINKEGELVGIGSLFVMDAMTPGERLPGNMFVPIDLLKPGLDEMIRTGGRRASHRPWLGVDSLEEDGRVKVMQVSDESPAAKAGLRPGDIILSVDGEPVEDLAHFYGVMWKSGPPGVDVRLTVLQGPEVHEIVVRSIDRQEFMRRKPAV
jgi:serine protease Do